MKKECENISGKENELAGLPVRRLFFRLAVPAVTQIINVFGTETPREIDRSC